MSDSLKILDFGLILKSQGLSTCCCDDGLFYRAIPCDMNLYAKYNVCADWDECQFENSYFVDVNSFCSGPESKVCECQRLKLYWPTYVLLAPVNEALTLSYNGSTSGYFDLTDGNISLQDSNTTLNIKTNGSGYTISDLLSAVSVSGFPDWTISDNFQINQASPPSVLKIRQSGWILTGDSQGLDTDEPHIYFEYEGQRSQKILHNTDPDTFANNITLGLFNLLGDVTATYNTSSDDYEMLFDIKFNGENCGVRKSNLQLIEGMAYHPSFYQSPQFRYGDRRFSYGNDSEYTVVGTNTRCPYEDTVNPGPYPFDIELYGECCPQRGVTLGPEQEIIDNGGYGFGGGSEDSFTNLETTIKIGEECFILPKSYFLFGIDGRISEDIFDYQPLYYTPSCNFGASGNCEYSVPSDCTVELVLPKLSVDLTWGPFGSYYHLVEESSHTNEFYGYVGNDYRPSSFMQTRGTWNSTEEIKVFISFYKYMPFATGLPGFDGPEDRVAGQLSSIPGGFAGVTQTPCTLTFATSGKTIGDFLDGLNGITTEDGCRVFAFCAGSQDARSMPASTIINTSSEVFSAWLSDTYNFGFIDPANNPEADDNLYSGATTFLVSKPYYNMFTTRGRFGSYIEPNDLNSESYRINHRQPPICRAFASQPGLDEILPYYNRNRNINPWFTSLQGQEDSIIRVRKNELSDPFSSLTLTITSGILYFNGSGPDLITQSGSIPTRVDGSGFSDDNLVDAINSITWQKQGFPFNNYYPFLSEKVQPYKIWIDDHTWWNGSDTPLTRAEGPVSGVKTDVDYSYKEPILDTASAMELIGGNSYDIKAFLRRRCFYEVEDFINGSIPESLPFCTPPNASRVSASDRVDCDGDNFLDGEWLLAYGCTSPVCKTQWFIKADRCPCETTYDCEAGAVPNRYVTDEAYSPTLYICELNMFNECTEIPMLVKVPVQVSEYLGGGAEDGCLAQYNVQWCGYTVDCGAGVQCDVPVDIQCLDEIGWCQKLVAPYEKVKLEDIPRTWPPTAYVSYKSNDLFCGVTRFIPEISYPNCLNPCFWNTCEILPITDGPHTNPNTGGPCNLNPGTRLYAYFRPVVAPLTEDDVLQNGGCRRLDADCNTKCCGCFFTCEPGSGQSCTSRGPVRCPCEQTVQYDSQIISEEIGYCVLSADPVYPPGYECVQGQCAQPVGGNGGYGGRGLAIGGTITTTTTMSYIIQTYGGCCACTIDGSATVDYNRSLSCPDGSYDGCRTNGSCGGGDNSCDPQQPSLPNCADPLNVSCINDSQSGGSCETAPTCNTDAGSYALTDIVVDYFYTLNSNEDLDECGVGSCNNQSTSTSVYGGMSSYPGCAGRELGILQFDGSTWHGTLNNSFEENVTFSDISCQTCGFGPDGISWAQLLAWTPVWECGEKNTIREDGSFFTY